MESRPERGQRGNRSLWNTSSHASHNQATTLTGVKWQMLTDHIKTLPIGTSFLGGPLWIKSFLFFSPNQIIFLIEKHSPVSQTYFLSPSVTQFSHSVVSDSLRPHGSQHARPPYPSQIPRVSSNSCPSVGGAIQPSHALSFPSPPAPSPSQYQGLFQQVNSLHEVAKVLEFQLQHQSFQWTPRTDLL